MIYRSRRSVALLFVSALSVALLSCTSLPTIATDVTYCCETGTEGIYSYRIEFEDTPEFLKPMLRDSASVVLDARGLEYTEGDAHAILLLRFVNRPLRASDGESVEVTTYEAEMLELEPVDMEQGEAWGSIAPGGGARFIAEVQVELKNSVTSELLWSGTMGRVHNVTEGSYMHNERGRAAMRNAFLEIFAEYPNPSIEAQ